MHCIALLCVVVPTFMRQQDCILLAARFFFLIRPSRSRSLLAASRPR